MVFNASMQLQCESVVGSVDGELTRTHAVRRTPHAAPAHRKRSRSLALVTPIKSFKSTDSPWSTSLAGDAGLEEHGPAIGDSAESVAVHRVAGRRSPFRACVRQGAPPAR
jgi:hypothetical protein